MTQIRSHTGLRGLAALLVVLYHIRFSYAQPIAIPFIEAFVRRSYLWVDMFFILSGFVICYTNDSIFNRDNAATKSRIFLINRLTKLYPLHIISLLALILFAGSVDLFYHKIGKSLPFGHWHLTDFYGTLMQVLLVNAWGTSQYYMWNVASWSISAEMFSYIMFIVGKNIGGRAGAFYFGGGLVVAVAFYAYIGCATGILDMTRGLAPIRSISGFTIGVLAFVLRKRLQDVSDWLSSCVQILSTVIIVCGLGLRWNDVTLIAPFVVLVYTTWRDRGCVARWLSVPTLEFLGLVSYAVYITHIPTLTVYFFFWGRLLSALHIAPNATTDAAYTLSGLALVVGVAWLGYRAIERPGRLIMARWLGLQRLQVKRAA